MRNLRFVCAQPATIYYVWQVEIIINNFIEIGISPNNIDIVCYINDVIPPEWEKLKNHYKDVGFYFYKDTRVSKRYTSSIRPNILKQHWLAKPEINDDVIFYHDNDILITKPIDWSQFLNDDIWYGSDTRFYIAHDYIISKGVDILDKMCEIMDIDKQIIKDNELNAIGAQYILKDISWKFWDVVEWDCERLYIGITELNNKKVAEDNAYRLANPEEAKKTKPYHTLQIWCADMWAILWNGWKLGKVTNCHPDLKFTWGTHSERDWNNTKIFHNAGVKNAAGGLFYKSAYMKKVPYNENLTINPNTASLQYYNYMKKVGENSPLVEKRPLVNKYKFSQWDGKLPKISAQCITYGRHDLLEEAIECFLRQDYVGEKELIILNDVPNAPIFLNKPIESVKIYNVNERFKTIGEKRNECIKLCTGDLILPWDDDDISLPWRMSVTVDEMKNKHYFKPTSFWFMNNNNLSPLPHENLAHAMGGFSKQLWECVGGYPEIQSGQDMEFENLIKLTQFRDIRKLSNDLLWYIYRWGNADYHLSGFGRGQEGYDKIGVKINKKLSNEKYILTPQWKCDYVKRVKELNK